MAGKKRRRNVPLYVWVSPEELQAIKDRMEQTGIRNMSAYVRKMALNGYVLQVDLSPVRELVSLQRRCANNLNQAALHVNTYGGLYQNELQALQKDYADLWGPLSELLEKLAQAVPALWTPCPEAGRTDFERGAVPGDDLSKGPPYQRGQVDPGISV